MRKVTDQRLMLLWHLAQANPAPLEDHDAGELADRIGREIIRRWLCGIEPVLSHHQGRSYYWNELRRFAKYVPPPGAHGFSTNFHHGEWVARPLIHAAAPTQPPVWKLGHDQRATVCGLTVPADQVAKNTEQVACPVCSHLLEAPAPDDSAPAA